MKWNEYSWDILEFMLWIIGPRLRLSQEVNKLRGGTEHIKFENHWSSWSNDRNLRISLISCHFLPLENIELHHIYLFTAESDFEMFALRLKPFLTNPDI